MTDQKTVSKRDKSQTSAARGAFILALTCSVALSSFTFGSAAFASTTKVPRVPTSLAMQAKALLRLQHRRELLGPDQSIHADPANQLAVEKAIHDYVKRQLPESHKKRSRAVAQTILKESLRYGYDPVFLLAVVQGESSFRPLQRGSLDEIGLMQIRPATAQWITKKFGMEWRGEKGLLDPVYNIKVGALYLNYLREKFDSHAQLYLAAYNMGATNVISAKQKNVWPKDYPKHVMRLYLDFYQQIRTPIQG